MILTTTPQIEGKQIVQYHGIVTGEVIAGINFVKDAFAGLRDFFGGRSRTYEKELISAKEDALAELTARAEKLGANAVVSIDLYFEVVGNSMLMVIATGTAVTIA